MIILFVAFVEFLASTSHFLATKRTHIIYKPKDNYGQHFGLHYDHLSFTLADSLQVIPSDCKLLALRYSPLVAAENQISLGRHEIIDIHFYLKYDILL